MTLGYQCMMKQSFSETEVSKAIERTKSFKFVGLTSHWRLSVCLLNYIQTGVRFIIQSQTVDWMPTNGVNMSSYDPADLGPDYSDAADDRLYSFAKDRLVEIPCGGLRAISFLKSSCGNNSSQSSKPK